jgi:hypothetical protein
MIKSVNFKKFRTSEFIQFFVDINKIYEENNPESLNLSEQHALLANINSELAKVFKQDLGSDITEEIAELDQRRDEAVICLRKLADAYTNHYDSAKKEAGQRMVNAIDKYGSKIYLLNYQAETSTVNNLVNDIETLPELVDANTLMGSGDVVSELKTSNNLFNERYLARVHEEAEKEKVSAGEVIKEGITNYRTLVAHTEAHATLNSNVAYSSLINQLNVLIDKYNDTVSGRGNSVDDNQEE